MLGKIWFHDAAFNPLLYLITTECLLRLHLREYEKAKLTMAHLNSLRSPENMPRRPESDMIQLLFIFKGFLDIHSRVAAQEMEWEDPLQRQSSPINPRQRTSSAQEIDVFHSRTITQSSVEEDNKA
jgi:hypothetical protein